MTAFHSPHWHCIATLKPRLRRHTDVSYHRYRRQSWYVMHDRATGKVHRFTPVAYAFLRALDGRTTVDEIWHRLASDFEADAPSQGDIVKLMVELHEADMLQGYRPPDADALQHHVLRQRRATFLNALKHPLSVTIPLWNPEAWLTRHAAVARLLFGRGCFVAWCFLVLPALLLAVAHASDLVEEASANLLSSQGLLLTGLMFPVMKLVHEAGHALSVKAFGGSVYRTGVILIGVFPVPYVDASTAAALPRKTQRIVIGAAGMMAEIAVAAVALYIWLSVEPGLVRAIAFSVIAIAAISVAIVNGNPLLRFDGYFILSDLIEIPNLAQRSSQFWMRRLGRWLAGVRDPTPELATSGERAWFIAYGPLAFVYRVVVLVGLSLWVATEYLAVGIAIATIAMFTSLVLPTAKGVRQWLRQAEGKGVLTAARWRLAAIAAISGAFVCLVPLPLSTRSEGIVVLPETAYIRATVDGFVAEINSAAGDRVKAGDRVLARENLSLAAEYATAKGRIEELMARLSAEQFSDRVAAEVTRAELSDARQRMDAALTLNQQLVSVSEQSGTLVGLSRTDLPGRFFAKGETIAIVRPDTATRIHALVDQDDIDLVRSRLRKIRVLATSDLASERQARIVREIPAAGHDLPSRALTVDGGGQLPGDADDNGKARTAERVFVLELELDSGLKAATFGGRVYVRFDHDAEPIFSQIYRRVRQLLLSNFHA